MAANDELQDDISDISIVEEEFEKTINPNIVEPINSFGYDCKRLFNMILIDEDTIVFASGSFLHYFSISLKEVTFRELTRGCGIGFITKNYHKDYQGLLTVGENGPDPAVIVYEHPSHNIRVELKGAAKQQFTCGSYNHTGELLATQAGYPDFMLTIWRWQTSEIILRSKAFQNDVLYVHFSRFNPILLVSCGLSHIKFWKMANTFTGLKLQGDLGRFGKTDFSDIYAVHMLADENVISGCEWGNMLLWEAGLIKFEITRKGRKPCHTKPIVRITMQGNEVMTVGMDGYIRVWLWDPIDVADPPDDDRYVEIEPMQEISVGNCEIRMLQKIRLFDNKHTGHYALDGHGGIWYFDLDFSGNVKPPQKIYACHGGKVISAQVSPINSYLMTLGEDSKVCLYDYEERTLLLQRHLRVPAVDILWFNEKISPSGMEILVCSVDGVIRHYCIDFSGENNRAQLNLIRPIKAHTAPLTCVTIDANNAIMVTGSMDHTIFMYALNEKGHQNDLIHFRPMGFVQFVGIPNCFCWKPNVEVLLIGCKGGEVYQYTLPKRVSEENTYLSYNLTDKQEIKSTRFVSVKSTIRRDLKRAATKKRKDKKRKRKLKNIEKLKANNPGLQIDMEQALADSEPDEEEEPLFIPPVPNPILWLRYTNRNTIWVSMGGYDAGYIYELVIGESKPYRSTIIADGDDIDIYSYLIIGEYLLFGLINGKLRLNLINPDDFTDLRNYHLVGTHDPVTGCISKILLSSNSKFLFTVGFDGNIFVYLWSGPKKPVEPSKPIKLKQIKIATDLPPEQPSLEQEKIIAEQKRKDDAAQAHENKVLHEIERLKEKFNKIYNDNMHLPEDLRIPHKDMLLDPRITNQIRDELQFELDDVREDLAYDLEVATLGKTKLYDYFIKKLDNLGMRVTGLSADISVYTFRVEILDKEFYDLKAELEERLREEELKRAAKKFQIIEEKEESTIEEPEETFFFGRNPDTIIPRFSKKMLRLLKSYRLRKAYDMERIHDWEKMQKAKPDPNRNHPDDDRAIEQAAATIGDYKLKTGADYEPAAHETLCFKYNEIIGLRERIYYMLHSFNERMISLRDMKKNIYEKIQTNLERLKCIHSYIPESSRKHPTKLRNYNVDDEYPEANLNESRIPGCGIEINDILYLEKRISDLLPKPKPSVYTRPDIKMGEFDMAQTLGLHEVTHIPEGNEFIATIKDLPDYTDPLYLVSTDDKASPWLIEMRFNWLLTLIMQQDTIIELIEQDVRLFDNLVHELMNDRLLIKYEHFFLIAYMMALNQELYILRDSEQIENQLLFNADNAMFTRNQAANAIKVLTRQIEDLRKQCDRLNDQINLIQAKFMANCKGHKFFDFLRRIFKKKWRPPKPPKGEDESSESSDDDESSSEEEEDDTKSIDSNDVTAIRLDETHCPPGLDRAMYDLAFKLRSDRHELERALIEANKQIDIKREEVKVATINVSRHTDVYNKERETLITFRRKRQQEINKIFVSVALRMSQIQHFREDDDYRDISKAVLFDADRLTELKTRASVLEEETIKTQDVYRRNVVHLHRMKIDLKFMVLESKRLQAEINDEMMRKFGMIIELDELEEEVLRKYIFELETTADQEITDIVEEMRRRNIEIALAQEELIRETQLNCDKQNVLSVLLEEKTHLEKMLQSQRSNYLKWLRPPNYKIDHDIEKLLVVHREQQATIKCLEEEIASLKVYGKSSERGAGDGENIVSENLEHSAGPDEKKRCPEFLDVKAYDKRLLPDDFIIERAFQIVQKLFNHRFGTQIKPEELRRMTRKVSRYLSQVAYSLDGELTEIILDCLLENLSTILPKKYLITLNRNDIWDLFNDIHALFNYDNTKVNYAELIAEFYEESTIALKKRTDVVNTIQFKLVYLFKQLIEALPYEEFLKESTVKHIVDHLLKEKPFDGRCISVENIVTDVAKYAEEHVLYGVSIIPIRTLAENISKLYTEKRAKKEKLSKGKTPAKKTRSNLFR